MQLVCVHFHLPSYFFKASRHFGLPGCKSVKKRKGGREGGREGRVSHSPDCLAQCYKIGHNLNVIRVSMVPFLRGGGALLCFSTIYMQGSA